MKHEIYTMTERAIIEQMTWDEAIYLGETETVKEFDSYEESVEAFDDGNYDPEYYGVC